MTVLDPMIEAQTSLFHNALVQSSISVDEVNEALEKMLKSDAFKRARRMCRLMRYLIEQSIYGSRRDMSEYAIGLEVFDRDPATYYPGEDPVVRVQIGRLRDRLNEYYSNTLHQVSIQFSIPLGNYCPHIQRRANPLKTQAIPSLIALVPLQTISDDMAERAFTQGVNEDLSYHLYKNFGSQLVAAAALHDMERGKLSNEYDQFGMVASYILEGSIQVEHHSVKVNIRLMDVHTHTIIWSQQYLENSGISLQLQAQLAGRICLDVNQCITLVSARGAS